MSLCPQLETCPQLEPWVPSCRAKSLSQADSYLDVTSKSIEVKEVTDVAAVGVALVLHLAHHHNVPSQEPDFSPHVHTINLLPNM